MKKSLIKSELNKLPINWKQNQLGELLVFKNGLNSDKNSYGKGIKFINVMEIINNYTLTYDLIPGEVSVSDEKIKLYSIKKGDIVFNRTSEINEELGLASVYLDDRKVVYGGFVIRGVFVNDSIIDLYKKFCFRSNFIRKQIITLGQGAVRSNIGQEDLSKVWIQIPPIIEQKAIANCLIFWEKAIEIQSNIIISKENRLKALTQHLLTGKKRLSGFSQNWKEVKLGSLFSERNETKLDNLPLLSIGQEGVYPQTDSNKRDISNADKSKYKRIVPGDIGYNTMRMWQGRSALSSLEGIVSPAYTILVPKNNVNPYYFSILFKTSKLTNLFWRNSQGLVEDTLNCKYKDFSKIKYQVPSFEEQNAIAEILKTAEKEIQLEKQKLEELKEQKKGLMQQLLTGKVRLV